MEQRDVWGDVRAQLAKMADSLDSALHKVPPFRAFARAGRPPVSIYEEPDTLVVCAEVPGVRKDDVSLSLKEHSLVIEGREDRARFEAASCVCDERGPAEFSREVVLPGSVDVDVEPTAALENGLLIVRLKRRGPERGRTVPIEGE